MKKKLVVLNTTIMLGLGSAFSIPAVNADTLHSKKAQIQEQRSGIQANISKAAQEIAKAQNELEKVNAQIARVNQAIKDNNSKISATKEQIAATNAEIEELKKEVIVIQERIEKRNEVLKERAKSFQESGASVGYLEVLMGSTSFSDFIDRVGAVAKIVEADRGLMEEHEADKKELEEKKASVEKKLAGLTEMKTELEGMQAQILEQKAQIDVLKAEVQQKEKQASALKADLLHKDATLASELTSIDNAIEQERKRQAAEAAKAVQRSYSSNTTASSNSGAGSNSGSSNSESSNNGGSSSTQSFSPAPKANGNINTAITAGYKYIGNSVYVFGGGRTASDVANGRFDCSGFVHWAFAQAGISVGSSTDSLKNSGTRVSTSEMQPGDLVFFNTYKTDGHVGIYIGGGKFIGSQSSTGVAIANMSSGYWAQKFNGRVVRVR
jgi:peptidoglycan DL-endopeptidase CwlO